LYSVAYDSTGLNPPSAQTFQRCTWNEATRGYCTWESLGNPFAGLVHDLRLVSGGLLAASPASGTDFTVQRATLPDLVVTSQTVSRLQTIVGGSGPGLFVRTEAIGLAGGDDLTSLRERVTGSGKLRFGSVGGSPVSAYRDYVDAPMVRAVFADGGTTPPLSSSEPGYILDVAGQLHLIRPGFQPQARLSTANTWQAVYPNALGSFVVDGDHLVRYGAGPVSEVESYAFQNDGGITSLGNRGITSEQAIAQTSTTTLFAVIDSTKQHLYGYLTDRHGQPLHSEVVIAKAPLRQANPQVAAGYTSDQTKELYLVVWQDYRRSEDAADVYAARVDSEGNVLDPNGFVVSAIDTDASDPNATYSDESKPQVTYLRDGRFFVAWRSLRAHRDYDLYGAYVSAEGVVFDPNGFLVSGASGDEQEASFTLSGDDLVIGYSHFDDRPSINTWRVETRHLAVGAPRGQACATGADCLSRYCSTACCNVACEACGDCGSGSCVPKAKGTACGGGYRCDGAGTACPKSCQVDDDCDASFACDPKSHTCVNRSRCTEDGTRAADPSNAETSCLPYRCRSGACATSCVSSDECAQGFVCTFDSHCAALSDSTNEGCAIATAEDRPRAGWFVGLGAIGLAIRFRLKRGERRKSVGRPLGEHARNRSHEGRAHVAPKVGH
jgi:hypothetical protein